MTNPADGVRLVPLTGRALRYVQVLKEFGHVDDRTADELIAFAAQNVEVVDLEDVRRAAAGLLCPLDTAPLLEDWPFLFS